MERIITKLTHLSASVRILKTFRPTMIPVKIPTCFQLQREMDSEMENYFSVSCLCRICVYFQIEYEQK